MKDAGFWSLAVWDCCSMNEWIQNTYKVYRVVVKKKVYKVVVKGSHGKDGLLYIETMISFLDMVLHGLLSHFGYINLIFDNFLLLRSNKKQTSKKIQTENVWD